MTFFDGFILGILLGLIPAAIAKGKGRSFPLWWFYGAMILIVALPHSLIMVGNMKKCPHCAETVKADASICKYCNKEFAV